MHELTKRASSLLQLVEQACQTLNVEALTAELSALTAQSAQPDFWQNSSDPQTIMQTIAKLEARVNPWNTLLHAVRDLNELLTLGDSSLESDITEQLTLNEQRFDALKNDLKFNGPYDDHAAIIGIYAGAGGTDAQDWAMMLLRMYLRYAERQGFKATLIDESKGDEAGLKSVTLEIDGAFAYGKLQGEHGVHRLVRLSPFNADNLRQTSFAKVEIMPKIDKPDDLAIDEKELKIDVYRSGGHGGQSVNTTDSAVRITHLPTGITVAIQNERSQLQNRETAMTIIRSRLAQLQIEQHQEQLSELKGPNQSAEWGNQIRSYVLHPYKQVKDLRTRYETSDPDAVLDGKLDDLIDAYLEYSLADN